MNSYAQALARDDAPLLWYWAAFDSAWESTAEYLLQDKGCETYIPRCLTPTGDVRPFLEFYMAIRPPWDVDWSAVRGCVGVLGVLQGASSHPMPCKPAVVEAIQALEDGDPVEIGRGAYKQTIRPITLGGKLSCKVPSFTKGERVIVDSSSFGWSLEATVHELDPEKRTAQVIAELFGRDTLMTVEQHRLLKHEAAAKLDACRKGGHARAESLSPERRREIARNAVRSRWGRHGQQV